MKSRKRPRRASRSTQAETLAREQIASPDLCSGMSDKPDFDEEMDRLQGYMPDWASRNIDRLRQPEAVWVRVPAGIALTGGGVFGFLPVLGFWMLPIGLALLAQD